MMIGFLRSMVLDGSGVKNIQHRQPWSEQVWELYERVTGQQRPAFFKKQDVSTERPLP